MGKWSAPDHPAVEISNAPVVRLVVDGRDVEIPTRFAVMVDDVRLAIAVDRGRVRCTGIEPIDKHAGEIRSMHLRLPVQQIIRHAIGYWIATQLLWEDPDVAFGLYDGDDLGEDPHIADQERVRTPAVPGGLYVHGVVAASHPKRAEYAKRVYQLLREDYERSKRRGRPTSAVARSTTISQLELARNAKAYADHVAARGSRHGAKQAVARQAQIAVSTAGRRMMLVRAFTPPLLTPSDRITPSCRQLLRDAGIDPNSPLPGPGPRR